MKPVYSPVHIEHKAEKEFFRRAEGLRIVFEGSKRALLIVEGAFPSSGHAAIALWACSN